MWSVVKSAGAISARKQVPFFMFVLLWMFVVTILGSLTIWAIETGDGSNSHDDLGGSNVTDGLDSSTVLYADSFFVALNGVTATGLSALDLSRLGTGSRWALMLCVQLGSATMLSTIPVWTRVRSLRKILPPGTRFDLRTFSQVPQWLVEYKALVFLLRIVFCYQLFVHLFWGSIMYILIATDATLAAEVERQCPQGLAFFVAFEVVSAYCNAGFSLLQSGDISLFRSHPGVLFCFDMLILHGNVLYPLCIRWIIIALSWCSNKNSSSKVYLRYLLLNGRDIYTMLFQSQQTWVLLITQMFLMAVQTIITMAFSNKTTHLHFSAAFSLATNTRHAGMAVTSLSDLASPTLLLYLLMMFLAPVPYITVLNRSSTLNVDQMPKQEQAQVLSAANDLSQRLGKISMRESRDGGGGSRHNTPLGSRHNTPLLSPSQPEQHAKPLLIHRPSESPAKALQRQLSGVTEEARESSGAHAKGGTKTDDAADDGKAAAHPPAASSAASTSATSGDGAAADSGDSKRVSVSSVVTDSQSEEGTPMSLAAENLAIERSRATSCVYKTRLLNLVMATTISEANSGGDTARSRGQNSARGAASQAPVGARGSARAPNTGGANGGGMTNRSHSPNTATDEESAGTAGGQGMELPRTSNGANSAAAGRWKAVATSVRLESGGPTIIKLDDLPPQLTARSMAQDVGPDSSQDVVSALGGEWEEDPGEEFWDEDEAVPGSWLFGNVAHFYTDTRLFLMAKYPDGRVPWSERISARAQAVSYHLYMMLRAVGEGTMIRDMLLLWVAWFAIAASMPDDEPCQTCWLYHIIFELVSAYGNVGLSLGSLRTPSSPCSFSLDLSHVGRLVVMAVMLLGRTRDLPLKIDSALHVNFSSADDILDGTADPEDRQHMRDSLLINPMHHSADSSSATGSSIWRPSTATKRNTTVTDGRPSTSDSPHVEMQAGHHELDTADDNIAV